MNSPATPASRPPPAPRTHHDHSRCALTRTLPVVCADEVERRRDGEGGRTGLVGGWVGGGAESRGAKRLKPGEHVLSAAEGE